MSEAGIWHVKGAIRPNEPRKTALNLQGDFDFKTKAGTLHDALGAIRINVDQFERAVDEAERDGHLFRIHLILDPPSGERFRMVLNVYGDRGDPPQYSEEYPFHATNPIEEADSE